MAKKIEVNIAMINPATFKPEPVLESIAFSIVKTGDKLYSVISVKFNLDTGESGNVEVLHKDLDLYEAQHQFKVETVNAELF